MKKAFFVISALLLLSMTTQRNLRVVYNSLDPQSIPEHLAFYELYPTSPEGRQSLAYAWQLIAGDKSFMPYGNSPILDLSSISSLISLISKNPDEKTPLLSAQELAALEKASFRLKNRALKGHYAQSESEVEALPPEEVDVARGYFLAKMQDGVGSWEELASYEAMMDLMALQILTKVSMNASPEDKIRAINHFIFVEMGYRFPPHSLYTKDIDLYTLLPSVLDSRRGVCLGVSILYLCIAQRLGLPLEVITPPGHIYVRYREGDKEINIETTARGIHLDSEEYLGIDLPVLKQRNAKETIGMAYFNEASGYLHKQDYEKALKCYLKASKYMLNDALLKELTAYAYLFHGEEEQGKKLLAEALAFPDADFFAQDSAAQDLLDEKIDVEGLKTVFLPVDETRESVIKKRKEIEEVIAKFPQFRAGYFHLAVTWLQLHRYGEALEILEQYHALDNTDKTAEYYLAALNAMRLNYPKAWEHLHHLEDLLQKEGLAPKVIKELKRELSLLSPE